MGLFNVMAIGSSGLNAQRIRMDVHSANLANMNTTRGVDGGPYRRRVPLLRAVEVENFGSDFAEIVDQQRKLFEVEVQKVVDDGRAPILVHEPDHPDADENGFVAYPDINMMEEMAGLMSAARSYEANVSAITAAKEMAKKALELGR